MRPQIKWPTGAGHIQINGTIFQLNQCHWHSPSEHTINGRRSLSLSRNILKKIKTNYITIHLIYN